MWPFDLPAHEALRLQGETAIAWATFDAAWYAATYADAAALADDRSDRGLLAFYLDYGQRLGHSPNRYFDETWHRRAYPNIAQAVQDGMFSSAFDAYCRGGNRDRSPHWLFDELYYRDRYPDLLDDALVEAGLANGYDHFLQHGNREGRIGHPLFDPLYYVAHLEPDTSRAAAAAGPFQHYLSRLEHAPSGHETSRYFASEWYSRQYPAVADAIAGGAWRSALEHYLCNDHPTAFDPSPDFSEDWYLTADPGLRTVTESGLQRNGFAHFLRHGAIELRSPAPHIDLQWYAAQEAVRNSLLLGEARDAFDHWLHYGKPSGQAAAPRPEEQVSAAQARSLFRQKASALLPIYGRAPLRFACAGDPAISVVMVVRDDVSGALATLSSLRNNTACDIDLVLMVLGTAPDRDDISRFVTGATIQRLDDVGVLAAADAGLACTRAGAVVWLEGGSEIEPGSIEAALRRLASDPRIGAVGGKVLRPEGTLRSAGYVVWRDGRTHAYQDGASPLAPEANFVRDVHFCGCALLVVRRDLGAIPPVDDGAAAGLCLGMIAAGHRVVYDPAVMIRNWNDIEPPQPPNVDTETHGGILLECDAADGRRLPTARYADTAQRRVLFIEDTVPLRGIGSGFVRANDLIGAMAAMGFAVTVFPVNGCRFGLGTVYADMPDSVEVMHDLNLSRLGEFLRLRRGVYDTIWISRTHNMDRIRPILDSVLRDDPNPPAIILDTEAVSAARDAAFAALSGKDFDLDAAVRQEFASAGICRTVIAVSETEATILRAFGFPNVPVIGHMRLLRPTSRPFKQRTGMLFAGAIHRMDSPNFDSLSWFVDAVLPIVEKSLGWETRLTIVGYTAPGVTLARFASHPRVTLRGAVPDLAPLYASHRLFIAPTRFAAGAPYKVHEAASHGLPVVATELLRAQLGWTDGAELLAADAANPEAFAARIVALYRDEALWTRLRDAALTRLSRENNAVDYAASLEAVLGPARGPYAPPSISIASPTAKRPPSTTSA
jgi:glycosyltransferase involved in cell wall biosynthesis